MKETTSIRHEVRILPQLEKACGLDMHKDKISAFISDNKGEFQLYQEFGTLTKDLYRLSDWLNIHGVKDCLMESTGIYWMALYAVLTDAGFNVTVSNPQHIKQIPKRKTDKKDAKWLCTLLLNGLVRTSFIPDRQQYELRDYCRSRLFYTQQQSRIRNRMIKILEICNIKIRSVASSIATKTCMEMIRMIASGEKDIDRLKMCCKGKLRKKMEQMAEALQGTITQHECKQLQLLLSDFDHVSSQLDFVNKEIEKLVEEYYNKAVRSLDSITGIGEQSAQVIISEIGEDMNRFPTADHLASWAGLAPGNHESAGKTKNTSVKKGNKYLRVALIAVAWGAVKTKNSYWRCLYEQLKQRMKVKKAIVAIARRMLKVIYKVIKEKAVYQEKGVEYYFELKRKYKTI